MSFALEAESLDEAGVAATDLIELAPACPTPVRRYAARTPHRKEHRMDGHDAGSRDFKFAFTGMGIVIVALVLATILS